MINYVPEWVYFRSQSAELTSIKYSRCALPPCRLRIQTPTRTVFMSRRQPLTNHVPSNSGIEQGFARYPLSPQSLGQPITRRKTHQETERKMATWVAAHYTSLPAKVYVRPIKALKYEHKFGLIYHPLERAGARSVSKTEDRLSRGQNPKSCQIKTHRSFVSRFQIKFVFFFVVVEGLVRDTAYWTVHLGPPEVPQGDSPRRGSRRSVEIYEN